MKKNSSRNKIHKSSSLLAAGVSALVRVYRFWISPALAPSCRFYPSCSSYALLLLRFENVILACCKIAWRIMLCNPLSRGGFAPPSVYMSESRIQSMRYGVYGQCHFLSKPQAQKPQKTTYFLINSHSHLLKLKKFYIIAVYL